MPGLSTQDGLQPSLLDRLTDLNPSSATDPVEVRAPSRRQLRQAVLRDLAWLLNAVCDEPDPHGDASPERLAMWRAAPQARDSVLNFGIPALCGRSLSVLQFPLIEGQVRQAIVRFEPRMAAESLDVRVANDLATGLGPTCLRLSIKGWLWNHPAPLDLQLQADFDVDTGLALLQDLLA